MGQGVQSCFIGQSEQILRGLEGLLTPMEGSAVQKVYRRV